MQSRAVSRSWLACSVWPLDCGCYPDERLTVVPSARQNFFQTLDVNLGPLSMLAGIPWIWNTWFTSSSAVSVAEGSLGRPPKCTALENRSTIVRMVSLPCDTGNPVTKSKAMGNQGRPGTGSGRRRPADGQCAAFPWTQTVQALTYSRISAAIVGHQKWRWSSDKVQKDPGWQANLDGDPTGGPDRDRYKQTTLRTHPPHPQDLDWLEGWSLPGTRSPRLGNQSGRIWVRWCLGQMDCHYCHKIVLTKRQAQHSCSLVGTWGWI